MVAPVPSEPPNPDPGLCSLFAALPGGKFTPLSGSRDWSDEP
jgi:hypothetical protein